MWNSLKVSHRDCVSNYHIKIIQYYSVLVMAVMDQMIGSTNIGLRLKTEFCPGNISA